jgi:hypothetical protein
MTDADSKAIEKREYLRNMGFAPASDADSWVKNSAGRIWTIAGVDVVRHDLEWLKRAVAEFAKQPLT